MKLSEAKQILKSKGYRLLKEARERIPCFLECNTVYIECYTAEGVKAYSNFVVNGDSKEVEPDNLRFYVDTWYDEDDNVITDPDLIDVLKYSLECYLLSPRNIDKWRVHATGTVQMKKPEVVEMLEDAGFRISDEDDYRQNIYLNDKIVGWLNDKGILLRPGNGEMPLHLDYHLVDKAARQYLMSTIQKMTGGV